MIIKVLIKACMYVCLLPTAQRAIHTGAHPANHIQHSCLHPDHCQTYCPCPSASNLIHVPTQHTFCIQQDHFSPRYSLATTSEDY